MIQRLLDQIRLEVRLRLSNGITSERALARTLGVSQPHLHNVLKGTRELRPALADRMLDWLGLSPAELLDRSLPPRRGPSAALLQPPRAASR